MSFDSFLFLYEEHKPKYQITFITTKSQFYKTEIAVVGLGGMTTVLL